MNAVHLMSFVLNVSMGLIVFGLGLKASFDQATYLLRRPELLARSLISMNVVMPVFAAVVLILFDLNPAITVALVPLALSPVPPILPFKQASAGGNNPYVIGLLATTAAAAIIVVPVGMAIVDWIAGRQMSVSMGTVAAVVFASVLVPLIAGLLFHAFAPNTARRVADRVSFVGGVLLVASFLPVLIVILPAMIDAMGNGTILVLAAFTVVGLVVGHAFGGPDGDDRTVLALATGARHPGVALAVAAASYPDVSGVLAVVLWHLIISGVITSPYVIWRRRVHDNRPRGRGAYASPHPNR